MVLSYGDVSVAGSGGHRRVNALLELLGGKALLVQPRVRHPLYETITFCPDFGRRKRGINWGIFNYFWPVTSAKIRRLVSREKPRAIIITHIWCYRPLPKFKNIPVILDAQNVDAVAIEERFGVSHPFSRMVRSWESRVAKRMSHIFVCSPVDGYLFHHRYGVPREKITVVPNAAHVRVNRPVGGDRALKDVQLERRLAGSTVLLFMGGKLDYQPNQQALEFIRMELLPALKKCAGASFKVLVTGKPLPPGVWPDDIIFAGHVPDVDPFLRRADIGIAPIFTGSGTRLKILEYMASGLPVVATPKAAEGIDCISGEQIMIAGPERFALTVQEVLDRPGYATELGRHARALIEAQYNWPASQKKWQAVLGELGCQENINND